MPPQKITLGIAVPAMREASPATRNFIEYVEYEYKEQN